MTILIVEDEIKLGQILKEGLELQGFKADVRINGREGLDQALAYDYDVIILDIIMPEMDGFEVCIKLRSVGKDTPIIMLTAREMTEDKIRGLNSGADDYLIKPFDLEELVARIRALLRRPRGIVGKSIKVGDLVLNVSSREVKLKDQAIDLSTTEFDLLHYLMRHPNQVLSREQIIQHIRKFDYSSSSNIVDVYLTHVRKKIGDDTKSLIKTVTGVGYKLVD
ncbi:MAG: response regulator transcription factor [bacterium]|nr:response regulator transcription factor [bacterium]